MSVDGSVAWSGMDCTQSQIMNGFECQAKKVGLYAAESGDPRKNLNREVARTSLGIGEVALPAVHDGLMKMRSRGWGHFRKQ